MICFELKVVVSATSFARRFTRPRRCASRYLVDEEFAMSYLRRTGIGI